MNWKIPMEYLNKDLSENQMDKLTVDIVDDKRSDISTMAALGQVMDWFHSKTPSVQERHAVHEWFIYRYSSIYFGDEN
jgi:hypothetical protein